MCSTWTLPSALGLTSWLLRYLTYSHVHLRLWHICILSNCILQVPSLKSPTPALYSSTREAAMSCITLATTYLASFTLAQLVLKVGLTAYSSCSHSSSALV